MPRKHLIASKINSKQQNQAKLLQKLSREIAVAAKTHGTNPDANPRLKLAIEKALKFNLSRESIQKNIFGPKKNEELINYHEYEVFGPENVKFIISALTDNVNRTMSNLKGYINKFDGQIAKMNAVKIYFKHLGTFIFLKADNPDLNEENLLELIIDFAVEDLLVFDEGFELQVSQDLFYDLQKHLENSSLKVHEAEIKWLADEYVVVSDVLNKKLQKFYEQCDEDDDIQNVYVNVEMD